MSMPSSATTLREAGAWPALILNADYRPLSTFPLSVWSWQDAIHAVVADRVDVVAEHDKLIHSASLELRLPSVVAVREFVPTRRHPAFTRHNVLLRDRFCCAYCGQKHAVQGLTFDHVIPRSRGGHTRWENIVAACHACNGMKANRTPEEAKMPLQWRPWRPNADELFRIAAPMQKIPAFNGWREFLYYETELRD